MNMAELMRLTDRGSQSPAVPLPPTMPPAVIASAACPTWNDAVTQMNVQNCLKAQLPMIVQPRLDSLAERLASVVASAQSELRDLERLVGRSEARVDGRLAGLEARVAVLADAAARTEQRERDLNVHIAGIAEGMLKSAEDAGTDVARAPRVSGLEKRVQDETDRLDTLEDICRKSSKNMQRLDDRLEGLEEQSRTLARRTEEMRSFGESQALSRTATAAVPEARLVALEEQVRALNHKLATEHDCHLALLESRLESHRVEFEASSNRFTEQIGELRSQVSESARHREEQCEEAKSSAEKQQALTARLDDMNLRVGTLKVKGDGLEGRMSSMLERMDTSRRQLEAQVEQQVTDHCGKFSTDADSRLEALEHQLGELKESCGDFVEQVISDRLAILSGATDLPSRHHDMDAEADDTGAAGWPLSTCGGDRSRRRSGSTRDGHLYGACRRQGSPLCRLGTPAFSPAGGDFR